MMDIFGQLWYFCAYTVLTISKFVIDNTNTIHSSANLYWSMKYKDITDVFHRNVMDGWADFSLPSLIVSHIATHRYSLFPSVHIFAVQEHSSFSLFFHTHTQSWTLHVEFSITEEVYKRLVNQLTILFGDACDIHILHDRKIFFIRVQLWIIWYPLN